MARVVHFDLQVKDVDRAIKFYTAAFGWKIEKWDNPSMDYWLIDTGDASEPGIGGGLMVGEPNFKNGDLTLGVDSVDDSLAKITATGGKVTREKSAIPGVGWMALVGDLEGNVFGLMEEDETAQ